MKVWRETALKGEMATTATRLTRLSHPFVSCYSSFAQICLEEQLYNVILPLMSSCAELTRSNCQKTVNLSQLCVTHCNRLGHSYSPMAQTLASPVEPINVERAPDNFLPKNFRNFQLDAVYLQHILLTCNKTA